MAPAHVQYVIHTALDKARTLRVHVIDVQLSLVRKHATPSLHAQVLHPLAGHRYNRRNHNVLPPAPFGLQPQPVTSVGELIGRVNHDLMVVPDT